MNFNEDLLADFVDTLGYNTPALLAMCVGIFVTIIGWNRHPVSARWALLGFICLFVAGILSIAWRTIGVVLLFPDNPPISWDEGLSYVVLSAFEALGLVFLMLALSSARAPYRSRHFYEDFGESHND